ncbi:MAG: HEAT repeat domain-containing protein [Planctomycetes bacterium]|nr:HEAT repeat domain-containing protein [Planctomycetota bacterium]
MPAGNPAGQVGGAAGGGATPRPTSPIPPHGGVTSTPRGTGPRSGVPTAGHRKSSAAALDWRGWWKLHRDLFVHVCAPAPIVSGSSDFLLGRTDSTQAGSGLPMTLDLARQEIRPILREVLSDRQTEVRVAAVKSIGKVGGPEAVHAILPLLRDSDPHVRSSAAAALGYTGDACALPYLESVIADESIDVVTRGFAAIGAGIVGGPDAAAALEPLVMGKGVSSELRATALVALGATACPQAATILRRFVRTKGPTMDTDEEALALESIARVDPDGSRASLIAATKARSGLVRASAACALGGLAPGRDDHAALVSLVESDPDPIVRAEAALALGRRADDGAAKTLARVLDDDANADVRPFAALGLAITKDAMASATLRKALLDPSTTATLRGACAIGLGILGDRGSIPALRAVYRASDPELRGWTVLSLGMIGDRSLVPDLEAILLDPRPSVDLEPYVLAAGLLGDRALVREVQKSLEDGCNRWREAYLVKAAGYLREESFVEPCAAALRNSNRAENTRAYAAFALGALGDRLEVPALTRLVAWRNPFVAVGPLAALLAHL